MKLSSIPASGPRQQARCEASVGVLLAAITLFGGKLATAQSGLPDLAPLSLAVVGGGTFSAIAPNPRIMVSWGVTNQGTGSAPGGWYDRVWFSTNGVVDANSVELGDFYSNQTLAPGASYQATNQVTLPLAGSANFWLFVRIDPQNVVAESNKANNLSAALAGSFTLTPPDLVPLNLALVGGNSLTRTAPNPQVQLTWAVTNQGNGTASGGWYDYSWFSTNGVVDANAVILSSLYHSQSLVPGDSYQATNQVTLPMAGSGSFWLFVQSDLSNLVFESNKVNNLSAALPVSFTLTPPDIVPFNLALVGSNSLTRTAPNPQVQLTWAVTNQGNGTASGGWYDYIWFSTNGVVDANAVILSSLYHGQSLMPGDSYQATNQVTLPMAGSGSFWLFVQSDLSNFVFESNKVNNLSAALAGSFTLTPPDLVPLDLALVGGNSITRTAPNPQVQLTWAVTNQGTGTASGGWYDYIWFSTNGVVDAKAVILSSLYHGQSLVPGDSYQATNQVTLPMAGSGSFWLFVQSDLSNFVFESNKVNNLSAALPVTFTLTPPDLVPINLALVGGSSVASPTANPQVQLTWAVTNQGVGTASGGWYDYTLFSTNGVVDVNSVILTSLYHNASLSPGASYQATNQFTLPMAASGNFWLFVQTDLSNFIFESNKVNNLSAALPGTFTLGTISRPTLGIRLDNGQVELFWPANLTGYHGQKAPAISASIRWSNFVSQPVVVGQEFRLTDGAPVSLQFYRLSQ